MLRSIDTRERLPCVEGVLRGARGIEALSGDARPDEAVQGAHGEAPIRGLDAEQKPIAHERRAMASVGVTKDSRRLPGAPQISGFSSQLEAIDASGEAIASLGSPIVAEDAPIEAMGATIGGGRRAERRPARGDCDVRSDERRGGCGDRHGRSHDWGLSARRAVQIGMPSRAIGGGDCWKLMAKASLDVPITQKIGARRAAIASSCEEKPGIVARQAVRARRWAERARRREIAARNAREFLTRGAAKAARARPGGRRPVERDARSAELEGARRDFRPAVSRSRGDRRASGGACHIQEVDRGSAGRRMLPPMRRILRHAISLGLIGSLLGGCGRSLVPSAFAVDYACPGKLSIRPSGSHPNTPTAVTGRGLRRPVRLHVRQRVPPFDRQRHRLHRAPSVRVRGHRRERPRSVAGRVRACAARGCPRQRRA